MQENKEKRNQILKGLFLLILFAFLLYKTIDYFGAIGYRETWTICLDYMHQGTFWGGQPHCEGAILPFSILWILDSTFGREYVQIATIIFSTIIAVLFFWIFFKVVKKESLETDFFWPLFFFGLFFYINSVTNIEVVLNSFFFFIAFYFLFYTETRWKYLSAGFFLLLSMLSKINVIVQIAFLLFWYGWEKKAWYIENKKLRIGVKKELVWNYGQIALPIIIGFWFFTVLYKYFWIYSWGVFTNQTIALSILQTIKEMIFFDLGKADIIYIPTILLALLGTYLFWKEKKGYALLSGPCFFLAIFLIIRAFGIQFATGVRYWSVMIPFMCMVLLRLKQLWATVPGKALMQGFLLIFLVYPGFYYGPFQLKDDLSYIDTMNIVDASSTGWKEKDAFVKEVHYGYSIVPEQEGRILLENDPAVFQRVLISFGSNILYEKVDFLTKKYMESHPDIWGFPRYQELLGENLIYNPVSNELNEKEKEVVEKIENKTYSLIIYGPPEWAISQKIISNLNNESLQGYCQIAVPNNVWLTEEGWHFSYFFFRDHEHCQEMVQKMNTYFGQNYESICAKDQVTANMITTVMRQNGVPFNKVCAQGGSALSFFKEGLATKKQEILMMIVLFSLPFFLQWKNMRKEGITERQKKIYYSILGGLLLIFMLLWMMIETALPYSTAIIQTIL